MRGLLVCLLLVPATASAHQGLTVGFEAPLGVRDVVTSGDPYRVAWRDGDLGSFRLVVWARPTAPAPYIHAWPLDAISDRGQPVSGEIEVRDTANALEVDTAALGPGAWFFWLSVTDDRGITEYQPPQGVLTIVAPGEDPPPAVWFDRPAALFTASVTVIEDSFEVAYTTRPAEGVTVSLLSSVNDLEGEALVLAGEGLPGGVEVPFDLPLRCASGAVGIKAVVRDAAGRTGEAFATARLSHRPASGQDLPADCPRPGGSTREPGGDGGGCQAGCGTGLAGLLALGALRRSRPTPAAFGPRRAPCAPPRDPAGLSREKPAPPAP